MQQEGIIQIRVESVSVDSATVKARPDGTGRGIKARGRQAIGRSRGGLTTKIHMAAASDRTAVGFSLSGRLAYDAPESIAMLKRIRRKKE